MLEQSILSWITDYGYFGLFSLLMFGIIGAPIPDETLIMFAGYLCYKGTLGFVPAFVSAALGSLFGITVSYILGRSGGVLLIEKYGPRLHIDRPKMDRVHRWFERIGHWSLTFGYFIPGVRHLAALVAGASKLDYFGFARFAYPGGILWVGTFLLAGYYFGEQWARSSKTLHLAFVITFGVILSSLFLYSLIRLRRQGRGEPP